MVAAGIVLGTGAIDVSGGQTVVLCDVTGLGLIWRVMVLIVDALCVVFV